MKAWRKQQLLVQVGEDEDGIPKFLVGREAKNLIQNLPTIKTQPSKLLKALLQKVIPNEQVPAQVI